MLSLGHSADKSYKYQLRCAGLTAHHQIIDVSNTYKLALNSIKMIKTSIYKTHYPRRKWQVSGECLSCIQTADLMLCNVQ